MIEISWAAVAAVCALLMAALTIIGFWMKFSDRITTAQNTATSAGLEAATAKIKTETLQRDLAEYQTKAAGMFVTDAELGAAERRISVQCDEIRSDIRGMTERLDRVLEDRK